MRNFIKSCSSAHIIKKDRINEDEMCWERATLRRKQHIVISWENVKEKDHLEDLDINGIILKPIINQKDGKMFRGFRLTQDRDKWPAVVNTMNLRVSQNAGTFYTS
jgi:hypothetical protein